MNQIGIRDFRRNLSSYLANPPFEITKKGKIIAVVLAPDVHNKVSVHKKPKKVYTIPKKIKNPKKLKETLKKIPGYCKHGRKVGLCEFGCTK